jgi:hypothetical protein
MHLLLGFLAFEGGELTNCTTRRAGSRRGEEKTIQHINERIDLKHVCVRLIYDRRLSPAIGTKSCNDGGLRKAIMQKLVSPASP